jgi:hypothetical protein
MSAEQVAVYADSEVLMEVDNNSVLIVGIVHVDFRPDAQVSPNALIKYYFQYNLLLNI